MNYMDKILLKNKTNLFELDKFISENRSRIKRICCSVEVYELLKLCDKHEINPFGELKYFGIIVIADSFIATNALNFVFNNIEFRFNMPCNCGCFNDEDHNIKLK